MIGRKNRFHGYGSLRYVYQHGKTVRGPLTTLKYASNPKREGYRLAVVVSRKVNKSAVVRNRIRRRVYECFRHKSPEFTGFYDMVFTVFHEQLADMPAADLQKLVNGQLKQAGILPRRPAKPTPESPS